MSSSSLSRKNKRGTCRCGSEMYKIYNEPGQKTAICCTKCKTPTMVNVKSKTCPCGSKMQPYYNEPGQKTAICCTKCKTSTMVNVKDKTCPCGTRPNYNEPGQKTPICCTKCKTPTMVNVVSKTCPCGSEMQPIYNEPGQTKTTAICCTKCKTPTMVNVKSKTCKSGPDVCWTYVKKKNDGYCVHCFMHLFPDKPMARNYKTKEAAVVAAVKEAYPALEWVFDKTVEGGCSKRRPDIRLDLGAIVLVIEIDENQHKQYTCSCENKRLMQLSQDVGHRPMVFLRFNPDDYIAQNGKNVTSCWGPNGTGVMAIKKSKQTEWTMRLDMLLAQMAYWIEHGTDKMVEVVQLYYDQVFYDDEDSDEDSGNICDI